MPASPEHIYYSFNSPGKNFFGAETRSWQGVAAVVVVLHRRGVSFIFASFFRCSFFRVCRRQMKICMRVIRIILHRLLNF